MSFQITTGFVEAYKANIMMLAQQKQSRLRDAVMVEADVGRRHYFDQIGSVAASKILDRHGDSPLVSTPHSRRAVDLVGYDVGDLIDSIDKVRMLVDPTSAYSMAFSAAMGRAIDSELLAAFNATAKTGQTGTGSATLAAGNIIAAGGTGLTLAKLRSARKKLLQGDVDKDEPLYIVCSAAQITDDLLSDTSVTSADFNTIRALVAGDLDTYVGFKFIVTELTPKVSTTRSCFAWAKSGMALAIGRDVTAEIAPRPDKRFSMYAYYQMLIGATRLEEAKVVQIDANEP